MDVVDILVFAGVIGISALIGVYYGYKDKRNDSINSYFFGSKSLNPVAVGLSLLVTYISAINFVSQTAECYIVGTEYIWSVVTRFVLVIPTTIYFVPAFRRLDIISTYEFVEMRFNKQLRRIAAICGVVSLIVFAGIAVYATAVTLSVLVGISTNWSIAITVMFCIFYTYLGGMKAVVWTDAAQFLFMCAGVLAIFIRGIMAIGGFENFYAALEKGERYTMFRFDYGIISRVSPLGRAAGTVASHLYTVAISQQCVQRYLSCKTISQARWASSLNMILGCLISLGLVGIGLVLFAVFETCDPVRSGKILSVDQILPYAADYLIGDIPGLVGLYVAALCSATLSTVSSSLNSLAIIVLEDFLCPIWGRLNTSERLKVSVGKVLVVLIGSVVLGIAYIASLSRSNVLQLLVSFTGIMLGPLTGLYLLGFFCPRANSLGGSCAFALSVAFGSFLFIGNEFFKVPYQSNVPPTFTYGCPADNETTTVGTAFAVTKHMTSTEVNVAHSALQDLFNLHFNLIALIGMLLTAILGYIISLITGPSDPSACNPKLFIPLVDNRCLPKSVIKFFRFGVPQETEWEERSKSFTSLEVILEDKL